MNYFDKTVSFWFYSKDDANKFYADITNNNSFKSFMCKKKLLGDTEPNVANGILKSTNTDMLLKYLNNIWRMRNRPLINCKVGLKIKWKKYYVLALRGTDNADVDDDYIIFTIKDKIICHCIYIIRKRQFWFEQTKGIGCWFKSNSANRIRWIIKKFKVKL